MDSSGWDAASWVEQELAGSTFKEKHLGRRLRKLLVQLADAVGAPIPLACLPSPGRLEELRWPCRCTLSRDPGLPDRKGGHHTELHHQGQAMGHGRWTCLGKGQETGKTPYDDD